MPASLWKSFASPVNGRVSRVVALPGAQRVTRDAEVHEIHPPDPASASRFVRSDRVLHGRQPTEQKFRTLSVWEDEESLMRFVGRDPHGQVMTDLIAHMGRTKFVQW